MCILEFLVSISLCNDRLSLLYFSLSQKAYFYIASIGPVGLVISIDVYTFLDVICVEIPCLSMSYNLSKINVCLASYLKQISDVISNESVHPVYYTAV